VKSVLRQYASDEPVIQSDGLIRARFEGSASESATREAIRILESLTTTLQDPSQEHTAPSIQSVAK